MSETLTLARPYARAAFESARKADALAAWSQKLGFSAQLIADAREAVDRAGIPGTVPIGPTVIVPLGQGGFARGWWAGSGRG